jgi:hypothetical protein
MYNGCGMVLSQSRPIPNPLECVEVHEIEFTASINEGLIEPGHFE